MLVSPVSETTRDRLLVGVDDVDARREVGAKEGERAKPEPSGRHRPRPGRSRFAACRRRSGRRGRAFRC
jgi:hypothetical protein